MEPVPLWRVNSLCAAQLKPLQFVNLPPPVPGPLGGEAWCAVSDSDSLQPEDRPQGEGEQSHAVLFSKHQNTDRRQPRCFAEVIWYVDTSMLFRIVPKGQDRSLFGVWKQRERCSRGNIWVSLLNLNLKWGDTWPLVNHLLNAHIWRANSSYSLCLINY